MELIGNYIETIKVAVNPVDRIDGIPLDAGDNHVYVNVARSNDNLVVYEDYCIRSRLMFTGIDLEEEEAIINSILDNYGATFITQYGITYIKTNEEDLLHDIQCLAKGVMYVVDHYMYRRKGL